MEDRLLQHSKSDESLFDDLKHVIDAPKNLLSHLVGSRTKEDRAELQRILTHLPVVRECRSTRTSGKLSGSVEIGQEVVDAPAEEQLAAKVVAPLATTPRVVTPGALAPMVVGTALSGRASLPPPATPPLGTPRSGRASVLQPPATAPARPSSLLGTPRLTTPRVTARLNTPRGQTPRVAGSAVLSGTPPMKNSPPQAMELSGAQTQSKPEDDKKARSTDAKAQGEATQRVIEKLAELGIDPEGMSATDILRIFYARGSGSSYWLANREAEKRLSMLNIRASTPKSFSGVLKPRAEKEIRRARDLPVTNVHEYLDQWEIAFLGDVCRSLRCFDEAAEGFTSEYMRKYTNRQYGTQSGRKKYNRPAT